MRLVYTPEDQEVIDKHYELMQHQMEFINSQYQRLWDYEDRVESGEVLDALWGDPIIKQLQADLNAFMQARIHFMVLV